LYVAEPTMSPTPDALLVPRLTPTEPIPGTTVWPPETKR